MGVKGTKASVGSAYGSVLVCDVLFVVVSDVGECIIWIYGVWSVSKSE